uniref:Uncharacterized protein n=1 Tax=Fagus sylvatica TaxID=28930 RepID=A0A2N9F4A7_FAGSY
MLNTTTTTTTTTVKRPTIALPPPPPLSSTPPPPLSSTPPPPLSRTPPPPRRRTRRSSKGRWYKSNVATGSAISLSSVSFVGFVFVIYRQYFKPEEDEPPTPPVTKILRKLTVPLEVTVQISVPDPTVKPKTPSPLQTKPPSPPPPDTKKQCCDSCASDWTPQRRPCYDSYVHGSWTQPYCGMLYPLLFNLCLPLEFVVIVTVVYVTEPNTCMQLL